MINLAYSYCHYYFIRVGRLTPNGNVSVDCGGIQTFTCNAPGEPIKWTTSGLRGISQGPFLARNVAMTNSRITSTDTGGMTQGGVSRITIFGFSKSDNGGSIHCVNADNENVRGKARISIGEWYAKICDPFYPARCSRVWFSHVY